MAKNSIYDYSTTAGNNTDIAGIGILGTNAVNNFDDAFRTIMAQIATDVSPRRFAIQGDLYGLTLSNNAGDATNDIDISVGMAATDSTTDPRTMVLASTLTKRLDAAWAVGTGNGGLDTGSIANTTYHIWLIQRSDTGVVDALFSTSATSPTMPTNYDRKRRIGSILRVSAAIVLFTQNGDEFVRSTPVADIVVGIGDTAAHLAALSVPTGIKVKARIRGQFSNSTTIIASNILLTSPDESDRAPNATGGDYDVQAQVVNVPIAFSKDIITNTSAQLRYRAGNSTSGMSVATYGWIDTRGRL